MNLIILRPSHVRLVDRSNVIKPENNLIASVLLTEIIDPEKTVSLEAVFSLVNEKSEENGEISTLRQICLEFNRLTLSLFGSVHDLSHFSDRFRARILKSQDTIRSFFPALAGDNLKVSFYPEIVEKLYGEPLSE